MEIVICPTPEAVGELAAARVAQDAGAERS